MSDERNLCEVATAEMQRIKDADECEIMEFDFEPLFSTVAQLLTDLQVKDKRNEELEAQLTENHTRAEEIISAREVTITRLTGELDKLLAEVFDLSDSVVTTEEPIASASWNWLVRNLKKIHENAVMGV